MEIFYKVYKNAEHFKERPPGAPFLMKSTLKRKRTDVLVASNRSWYNETFRINCYSKYYAWTVSSNVPRDPEAFQAFAKTTYETCRNIKGLTYVLETSENNKLHLHGIICSSDYSKFCKIRKHLLFHSEFKLISFYDGWLAYMLKETPLTHYDYIKY